MPEYLATEGAAVKAAQMSFMRSSLQLPDYFARLCINEWIYRSLSYSTNDSLNTSVAFPNTQLPSQDAHLATIDYQPKKRSRSMEMSIQVNLKITFYTFFRIFVFRSILYFWLNRIKPNF